MEENKEPQKGTTSNEKESIIETKVAKKIGDKLGQQIAEGKNVDENVIVFRHDNPTQELKLRERELFRASGTIDTVSRYFAKRVGLIDQLSTTVTVERDEMQISAHSNETDYFGDKLTGELKLSSEFKKFQINDGTLRSPKKLAEFIRMNRFAFSDKQYSLKLVTLLMNFEANVEAKIEEKSASNGNKKSLREQIVTSNIPDSFEITLPIFKSQKAQNFVVEIIIDPDTLQCKLESPEAQELLDSVRNNIIDEEIEKIKALAPDVLIIEK